MESIDIGSVVILLFCGNDDDYSGFNDEFFFACKSRVQDECLLW